MSPEEIYLSKTDEELVAILENKTNYQDWVIKLVEVEFKKRNIPPEFSNKIAKKVYKDKLKEIVLGNGLADIEHEIPESYFLTETQMKRIYKQVVDQRRALLRTMERRARRL
ncbi:MAG: hypothetical protein IPM74_11320 [Crocinitomicaceae bacterium]|nr:hypothetical protein [Crocinitomicaceae bacterium]MBK8926472.1 hypothetical protein [Crocinitomicaceae bacterium]